MGFCELGAIVGPLPVCGVMWFVVWQSCRRSNRRIPFCRLVLQSHLLALPLVVLGLGLGLGLLIGSGLSPMDSGFWDLDWVRKTLLSGWIWAFWMVLAGVVGIWRVYRTLR